MKHDKQFCHFQCLLGDKYGYRPFPCKINAIEFEMLLEIARETYDEKEHVALLSEWYWKVSGVRFAAIDKLAPARWR